jgi:hypothetical protein
MSEAAEYPGPLSSDPFLHDPQKAIDETGEAQSFLDELVRQAIAVGRLIHTRPFLAGNHQTTNAELLVGLVDDCEDSDRA